MIDSAIPIIMFLDDGDGFRGRAQPIYDSLPDGLLNRWGRVYLLALLG